VALERQSIEKKDFPIGRRGYDPEAVDTHLSSLADEVDELKRTSRRRVETLASSASEQVRAIVEAAETSASDIQRQAEEDAKEIRSEANTEARVTREQATSQAKEYVGKVSESTTQMLQRLDAMEGELGALTEALRTGANRLNADLQLLEGNLTEVGEAAAPARFEPESESSTASGSAAAPARPAASATEAPAAEPAAAEASSDAGAAGTSVDSSAAAETGDGEVGEPVEGHGAPADGGATAADTAVHAVGGGSDDTEGARLIALNMALNGTPREETERYLAENFQLSNRSALLDEVYASVDG
jgi:DivIVA domain-containing protein